MSYHRYLARFAAFAVALGTLVSTASLSAQVSVSLTTNGKAVQSIVVAESAAERTRNAAQALATTLERISTASFDITTGDGQRGIAVGTAADFPALNVGSQLPSGDLTGREAYLIRSHAGGLWLLGATELAVEHAVWDLLYRLGYRQYFPGAAWEVVPRQPTLRIAVDSLERPDYHARRIWYGYGMWDYNAQPYAAWCAKNRCVMGVQLSTGHAYDGVVRSAKQQFEEHPEYWPLLDGKRQPVTNPKPCLGNPAVRQLFVQNALAQFEKNPDLDSVSMDPSDGGGWCECERCAALGSVSDQVVTLANEVAAAVNQKYPGKLVGIYAYNYHSPPPGIRVHPNVVVSVATAFIKGGLSLDEIVEGWARQGATLGIREYYSVNVWDRDQPAHARGGNLDYLRRTIPQFHATGARYMSAESSDNWGPNGLGYYLAARMLWDTEEAEQTDALIEDFLTRAFGAAREPMRKFYEQLDGSQPHLVVDDQLGRMFRALQEAMQLADSDSVKNRIRELALYAHYCSLYHQYSTADGAARQAAFEALIRHAYRMRTTMLIHTKALYRDLVRRDKTVAIPDNAQWGVPEAKNPWKSSQPFSDREIDQLLREGAARHPLVEVDFEPVEFSLDLVPATPLVTEAAPDRTGEFGPGRGEQIFYTYVAKAPATITLEITGGLIVHYRDRGNVRVELWQLGGASETGERETRVAEDRSVPPDGKQRTVKLSVAEPGLYRIVINDGNDRTLVTWPDEQPMTVHSSIESPISSSYHQWNAWFYVPRGTRTIGLFGGEHGEVRDSQGRPHFWLNGRERNYYSVSVPPGEDGTFWEVRYVRGDLRLLTVPPLFARHPRALLLPREVE